eukprot:157030_1
MASLGPLKVQRLHHLSRTTMNCKRLTDFYKNVMGFKQIHRPIFPFDGAWLQLGDIQLHVIERNPEFIAPEDPFNVSDKPRSGPIALSQGHHSAFWTEDFDQVITQLNKFNIEHYIGKYGNNLSQVWFYDPDGNGIEVLTRVDPNQQSKL